MDFDVSVDGRDNINSIVSRGSAMEFDEGNSLNINP